MEAENNCEPVFCILTQYKPSASGCMVRLLENTALWWNGKRLLPLRAHNLKIYCTGKLWAETYPPGLTKMPRWHFWDSSICWLHDMFISLRIWVIGQSFKSKYSLVLDVSWHSAWSCYLWYRPAKLGSVCMLLAMWSRSGLLCSGGDEK